MDNVLPKLWKEKYYDKFIRADFSEIRLTKKALTTRVHFESEFKSLRRPLDFNKLVSLIDDKYSEIKVPKALLKSLSGYFEKQIEEVDFVDLAQMYCSIKKVLGEKIGKENIEKWSRANREKISFFGVVQYTLMEDYLKSLV